MGAESFCAEVQVKSDGKIQDAFTKVKRQAQYDHGHAGYTGTIAEKDNWIVRQKEPFATQQDAMDFVEKDQNENDKWGPAFVVSYLHPKGLVFVFYGYASS